MHSSIGSLWRKWDFHVHTPESALNNQFSPDDWGTYVHKLFAKAIKTETYCIGITDYFLIEGYKKVLGYLQDDSLLEKTFENEIKADPEYIEKIKKILVFPNIEFRTNYLYPVSEHRNEKIQFHVIFSNEVTVDDIQNKFLNKLTIITSSNTDGASGTCPLTKDNICRFGETYKRENSNLSYGSPYFWGLDQIYIDPQAAYKILNGEACFKEKFILVSTEDLSRFSWNGSEASIRKVFYGMSNCIFSSNESTKKWGLFESKKIVGHDLPCIWGSDAHCYDKMFSPDNDNFCWIKSDLSFQGFLESLQSPENRIFIGNIPPELSNFNSRLSVTIESIQISKINIGKTSSDNWFSSAPISLNPFMVSIIGNKGSGKSALSDILGLACNSHKMSDASFLNDERFLSGPSFYGRNYTASITWYDGNPTSLNSLDQEYDQNKIELAQYLPQKAIENICNDLGNGFNSEINNVIFSFLDPSEKKGKRDFDELISVKTASIENDLQIERDLLESANRKIILLENRSTSDYLVSVKSKLAEQEARLSSHLKNRPAEVTKPDDAGKANNQEIITCLNGQIESLALKINGKKQELSDLLAQRDEMKAISDEIENENKRIDLLREKLHPNFSKYGVSASDEAKAFQHISIPQSLGEKNISLTSQISDISLDLGIDDISDSEILADAKAPSPEFCDSFSQKYRSMETKKRIFTVIRDSLTEKVSYEAKKYFDYLSSLSAWENERKKITGEVLDEQGRGSIDEFKKQVEYLEGNLKNDILAAKAERLKIVSNIFDDLIKKKEILEGIYSSAKGSIDDLLADNQDLVSFGTKISVQPDLSQRILSFVNKSVRSSYQGNQDGQKFVNESISKTDFNEKLAVMEFVSKQYSAATDDMDNIEKLLGIKRFDFYQFIGNLEYLLPSFEIKMNGKEISKMSPGEKGILLLIFYLALSNKNIPLIIDQPEDNLDNQSVFSSLVPYIKKAKKKRQIIMVTHNPNIAVACDSEQIVYCSIDQSTNCISYESGSIEEPAMKKHILDVLEGTKPAFDFRKNKYKTIV